MSQVLGLPGWQHVGVLERKWWLLMLWEAAQLQLLAQLLLIAQRCKLALIKPMSLQPHDQHQRAPQHGGCR